ncbi:MAG TPA: ABC transporter permease [Blastocatellia bacterium]|nr:ABC transporter permease [Blastocatellia bacterium]
MGTLLADVRFGFRMLLKKPGITVIAVLALALGIGANSAVFSMLNAILLRPLPFDDLDRIVALWERVPGQGVERNETAIANYLDWKAQNQSFEHLAIYTWWSANLTGIEPPERIRGFRVSANLLDAVGVKPALGRNFTADEEQPGRDAVAILSHGLWQRRFGGDPEIVGKTITLNGLSRTIVGVMPQDVNFPRGGEVMAPLAITPELARNRGSHGYLTVARLKPGVTVAQAQSDLDEIARRLAEQYPNTNTGRGVSVTPILADTVRSYKAASLVMMGAVGFVLLIACANVANLLLARATARQREIAVRLAMGASRWRIIRQLLTESAILGLTGGAAGLLVALWGVEALKAALPDDAQMNMPGFNQLGVNERVLIFTLAVSLLTGLIFGLAPAWQASKPDLNETLREGGGKALAGSGRHRLRSLLVVAEIALSLVLLIGAGLQMKGFLNLLSTSPGFNSDSVLTMTLTLPAAKYRDKPQRRDFFRQLAERLSTLPAVEAAGMVNYIPLGQSNSSNSYLVEGIPDPPPGQDFIGRYRVCTPDYFRAMGIRLIKGRVFTEADTADSQPVVIVNEALERKFWPGGSALGKHLRNSGPIERNPWLLIVGVVADVKHEMDQPVTPEFYVPHTQDAWATMVIVARTQTEPLALAQAVRHEVQTLDRDQPVSDIRTMTQVRDRSIMHYRFSGAVLAVLAVFALLLATTGIYGVMSYAVSQRTHEIGIRMALGADSREILRLVIGHGLRLTMAGMGVGLLGAYGLGRAMGSLLFGVSATDWQTYFSLSLLLALVALLACWLPAQRATRVDPMIALRDE